MKEIAARQRAAMPERWARACRHGSVAKPALFLRRPTR